MMSHINRNHQMTLKILLIATCWLVCTNTFASETLNELLKTTQTTKISISINDSKQFSVDIKNIPLLKVLEKLNDYYKFKYDVQSKNDLITLKLNTTTFQNLINALIDNKSTFVAYGQLPSGEPQLRYLAFLPKGSKSRTISYALPTTTSISNNQPPPANTVLLQNFDAALLRQTTTNTTLANNPKITKMQGHFLSELKNGLYIDRITNPGRPHEKFYSFELDYIAQIGDLAPVAENGKPYSQTGIESYGTIGRVFKAIRQRETWFSYENQGVLYLSIDDQGKLGLIAIQDDQQNIRVETRVFLNNQSIQEVSYDYDSSSTLSTLRIDYGNNEFAYSQDKIQWK